MAAATTQSLTAGLAIVSICLLVSAATILLWVPARYQRHPLVGTMNEK
jgi:hypothetical protein